MVQRPRGSPGVHRARRKTGGGSRGQHVLLGVRETLGPALAARGSPLGWRGGALRDPRVRQGPLVPGWKEPGPGAAHPHPPPLGFR